jgi:hypothetical protein
MKSLLQIPHGTLRRLDLIKVASLDRLDGDRQPFCSLF